MKNTSCRPCPQNCSENQPNPERRKFLQGAAVAAGGIVLGLQSSARADEPSTPAPSPPAGSTPVADEVFFNLSPALLETVGASEVIETANDKIIVARVGPATIIACSAICTHRGCTLDYKHESGQFVCPCHGARFETTGKVVKGPAKRDLKSYQARLAVGISAQRETPEK